MRKTVITPIAFLPGRSHSVRARLRNPENTSLTAVLLLLLVALLFASAALANNSTYSGSSLAPFLSGVPQAPTGATRLEPGKPVEQDHAEGLARGFTFAVVHDRYYHIGVEQQGIDVTLKLTLPDKKVIERDWPNSHWGPESLSFIAGSDGEAKLQVVADPMGVQSRKYVLILEQPQEPTAQNRNRIAGEDVYQQGLSAFKKAFGPERTPVSVAIDCYQKAVRHFSDSGDDYARASALTSLGFAYLVIRQNDLADETNQNALSLWRALKDPWREAQMLHNASKLAENREDPSLALKYYGEALKAWQALGPRRYPEGESATYNNMAGLIDQLGEREGALEHYKKALELLAGFSQPLWDARAHNNIALIYDDLGEHEEAYKHYSRALEIRDGLKAQKRDYDPLSYALTLNNLGNHFLFVGNPIKAREYLDRALDMRQSGNSQGKAFTQYSIALVLGATRQQRQALKLLEDEVLPYHRKVNDLGREAITLGTTGTFKYQLNDKAGALADFNLALEKSRAQSDRSIVGTTLSKLGSLESELGNLVPAEQHLSEAIDIFEWRRIKIVSLDWRASYLASVHDAYEHLVDVEMRLYQRERNADMLAKAFRSSERAHARSLLDLLTEAGADVYRDADPVLKSQYLQLKRQANILERSREASIDKGTAAQVAGLERQIREIIIRAQEVDAQVKKSSTAYADLTRTEPLSLDDVRKKLLNQDTLLLEYLLGVERSYLFVISSEGIEGHELPSRAKVEAAALAFYSLVSGRNVDGGSNRRRAERQKASDSPSSGSEEASAALSTILLGPAAGKLGTKRLLIVPDGAVHYVPFAALPAPSPEGQATSGADPLIVAHEIAYLPSASTLEVIRARKSKLPTPTKMLAVVADPVFERSDLRYMQIAGRNGRKDKLATRGAVGGERLAQARRSARESGVVLSGGIFPRLPKADAEAKGLLSLVPQNLQKDARGFDANYEMVMSGELANYKYVHFATHGLLNPRHPSLSGIVLSLIDRKGLPQEGFLRLGDIEGLNMPAELVVLSACWTASGVEIKGEGLVGLTRGVMRAGSSRVVASLWKADDKATAEFMQLFYEGMFKESHPLTPAAALRAAQEQMWQKYRNQSPYFWAAFVLQGEWR